jgi:hypothetical protein
MAKVPKRRTPRPPSARAGQQPAKNEETRDEGERRCWLCSQPLTTGAVTSLLGHNVVEVHQRCYEQAMKM